MKLVIKKADILLINCPNWEPRWPNMGIGYISESLRSNNFKVEFIDLNRLLINASRYEEKKYWQPLNWQVWRDKQMFPEVYNIFKDRIDELTEKIVSSGNNIFGFSVTDMNWRLSTIIAEKIKSVLPGSIIIFGGYDCQFPNECLEKYSNYNIDYIFIDEAEHSLIEFLTNFYNGKNTDNIHGIISMQKPDLYVKRDIIKDIDSLPFPTYKEYDFNIYPGHKSLMVMGSRGCSWAKCTICPDTERGGIFRVRSAENIFNEINYHYKNNGISDFVFGDAEINGHSDILEELCDRIISNRMHLKIGGQLRVDTDPSPELYSKLKKSGFDILLVGLESGSPDILKKMNKGFTREHALQMFKTMKNAGIKTAVNLIVGFPGEKLKHFYETMNFIGDNKDVIDHVEELNACMVYKHCILGKKYKHYGVISDDDEYNWIRKDGNTIMERLRRIEVMSQFIDSLGLARGYKWQEYDREIL